ncbi:MAG TPA: hypothetical protein PLB91_02305 [Spirochaetales bacterium]|nr:hypothetical protein [Spirochaetales bacterium]HRY53118.1 hypothetical protein [Spirochaetia bacterium]HRZ64665.1 hypothetical protein [Spirochaetia bacterium]
MTPFQLLRRLVLTPLTGLFYLLESLSLPASLDELAYDEPVRLRVPTYEGSGQATHPDILGPDASGRPFLLAFTPYPFEADRYENPSILASGDGLRFREERAGLNPLAPAPAVDHNDDPDLFQRGGEYGILYLETLRPERQNLVLLRSRDRLSWERSVAASFELRGPSPDPFILSPALASRGEELYLYYVDKSASPYRIEYRVGRDLASWGGVAGRPASFDRLPFAPWHVDVAGAEGEYYLLITSVGPDARGGKTYDLWAARSADLESWELAPAPVFATRPFGCRDVYRSSALVRGGDLFVYFSYKTRAAEWKLGLVRKRLSDLFPGTSAGGR